ncbi:MULTISPECIES: hypothetical protein [Nonomuraea]|uniref:Uncharacterized protein n=1 Tax=Nonomuraea africana TaxID=46171 RepID=A0ABR9KXP8_9ACTN|nr:hypothetical protein [Nonomuraea africana]MBE1566546.1 hypothetical protein [Nonomuraea africana]
MTQTRTQTAAPAPRWRCFLRPCQTLGEWQPAPTGQAARAGQHRHYLDWHWEQA